jgi:hypothetical protein
MIIKSLPPEKHHDLDILIKPGKPIHVHEEIEWGGVRAISNEFMWKHALNKEYNGEFYIIPDELCSTFLDLAHSIFETGRLLLKTIIEINTLTGKEIIDLREEAKKMGWVNTFDKLLMVIPHVDEDDFDIPLMLLAYGIWETKAFRKLWGARYILWERLTR